MLMAVFRWRKPEAVALARRRSAREPLFRRAAAQFLHFLPGSQFVQARPALAQTQLRTVQVEPDEQTQHGSSRARVRCRFASPRPWEYPASSCWATDEDVLFEREGGAGPASARNRKAVNLLGWGGGGASFSVCFNCDDGNLSEPNANAPSTDRASESCVEDTDSCVEDTGFIHRYDLSPKGNSFPSAVRAMKHEKGDRAHLFYQEQGHFSRRGWSNLVGKVECRRRVASWTSWWWGWAKN